MLCSEKTNYCFVITERTEVLRGRYEFLHFLVTIFKKKHDMSAITPNSSLSRMMVFRGLQVRKDYPGLLLSYARLLIPESEQLLRILFF